MALDDDHIPKVTTEEEEELLELPAMAMTTGSGKSSRDEPLLVDEMASSELNIDAINSSSVRSFYQCGPNSQNSSRSRGYTCCAG